MRLTFLGATDTVTGSRFLVETPDARVLVDCGLFQGIKRIRRRNWAPFPVEPDSVDAVLLTHAHIDHSGYLPALVRNGFSGPVWCTEGTAALLEVLLPDAAYLQVEDARHAARRGSSRHDPPLPLFDGADAQAALQLLRPVAFGEEVDVHGDLRASFHRVGHIVGASCVRLSDATPTSVLFTGDVGRRDDPIMQAPPPPPAADHVVTESTYGQRVHPTTDPMEIVADVVNRTIERGGAVLVPTFAVGRAQALLHLLATLQDARRIPDVPVFLNSPMAIAATQLFRAHPDDHRLDDDAVRRLYETVTFVRSVEESKALTRRRGPAIILSASGMATGGRVLHHLRALLPHPSNTVLFVGYQAAGTRGATLVAGTDRVKIFGEQVPVRAEIASLDGLSAHADGPELSAWLATMPGAPKRVWVVHGEPAAADAMRVRLRDDHDWQVEVPRNRQTVRLGP